MGAHLAATARSLAGVDAVQEVSAFLTEHRTVWRDTPTSRAMRRAPQRSADNARM